MNNEEKIEVIFNSGNFKMAYKLIKGSSIDISKLNIDLIDIVVRLGEGGTTKKTNFFPTLSGEFKIMVYIEEDFEMSQVLGLRTEYNLIGVILCNKDKNILISKVNELVEVLTINNSVGAQIRISEVNSEWYTYTISAYNSNFKTNQKELNNVLLKFILTN